MTTTITVHGRAEQSLPPERANVHLTVGFEGPNKDGVHRAAIDVADDISRRILELHDNDWGPITWYHRGHTTTGSRRPWNQDGETLPLTSYANVPFTARFSDFAALANFIDQIAGLEGVSIGHIEWSLTQARKDEITLAVRSAAVRDARDKAQQYADSLELGQVTAIAIADTGMLEGTGRAADAVAFGAVRSAAAPGSGKSRDVPAVVPEDITVSVAVDGRFLAEVR